MNDGPLFIFLFFVLIFLWALVGHGIWLATSAILRQLFGTRCSICRRSSFANACPFCRLGQTHSTGRKPDLQEDLASARRLLGFTQFHRWLSDEQTAELASLLSRLERRVNEENVSPIPTISPQSIVEEPLTKVRPLVAEEVPIEIHPLDIVEELSPHEMVKPTVPQRMKAGFLKSFMEQSNIRWIELISAALIVVCSVGLVISLWSTLSSTSRFFPSLVFLLSTVAVHGAGQYTLRQWKLRSTSRGILHIGLMLIPLAVLIGILLSRRPGVLPKFDGWTFVVILIGCVVYGGLSVTAARALFSRRWPFVAASSILSSATLIPIHYLGQYDSLSRVASIAVLLPIVAINMGASAAMIRLSRRKHLRSMSMMRGIAGVITQVIFAASIVFGFWIFQARGSGGVNEWWWVAAGAVAAAWAGWGWIVSLTFLGRGTFLKSSLEGTVARIHSNAEASWFAVVAWSVASVGSLFLAASVWQVGLSRAPLIALMAVCTLSWIFHGWFSQLRISWIAGFIALLCGMTFALEGALGGPNQLEIFDWIRFARVATLSSLGGLGAFIGSISGRIKHDPLRMQFHVGRPVASVELIGASLLTASVFVIALAAGLTGLACFVDSGETPYGGNWAPSLLVLYGLLGVIFGIAKSRDQGSSRATDAILPIGLSILALGAFTFCQSSPIFESWLQGWRPYRAWSIGAAIVALFTAIVAAGLRRSDAVPPITKSIEFLSWYALVLSGLSAAAIWTHADHLSFAARWGWFLPAVWGAIFYAKRSGWVREWFLPSLVFWTLTVTYVVGRTKWGWENLGWATTTAAMLVTLATTVALFEWWLAKLSSANTDLATDQAAWWNNGPRIATAGLLISGWCLALLGWFPAAVYQIVACIGIDVDFSTFDHFSQRFQTSGWFLSIVSLTLLTGTSFRIGQKEEKPWLIDGCACSPVLFALSLAAWIVPPYSAASALWGLAGFLMLSELAAAVGIEWKERSAVAWLRLFAGRGALLHEIRWLALVRATALASLILGTAFFVGVALAGILPVALGGGAMTWGEKLAKILVTIGPMLSFAVVRWCLSHVHREEAFSRESAGILAAIAGGTWMSLSLAAGPNWPTTPIVGLQSMALMAACLGWLSILWQERTTERSAQRIGGFAMLCMAILSGASALLVIFFPAIRLDGIDALGKWPLAATAVVVFALYGFHQCINQGSFFASSGNVLGMSAPLGAIAYASWLQQNPQQMLPGVGGFEPFRMLVSLWLAALAIGFGVRLIATRKGTHLSRFGELVWIALAATLAFLGAVSIFFDPAPAWPCGELSILALLTVLSGVVSRQAWRGHVAAVLAAMGLSVWLRQASAQDSCPILWNILWGPTWVAFAAICARLAMRSLGCLLDPIDGQSDGLRHSDPAVAPRRLNAVDPSLISVEKSVSLLTPIASAGFSFAWVYALWVISSGWSESYLGCLALSFAGLLLSLLRLWEPVPGKRGLAVYLNGIACCLVFSAGLGYYLELPHLHRSLIWLASGLGGMAIIAGVVRELTREASIIGPAFGARSLADPSKLMHAMRWMSMAHTLASFVVLVPTVILVLALPERSTRVAATALPLVGALSILPISSYSIRNGFRYAGLFLMSCSVVLLAWADLPNAWTLADYSGIWSFFHRTFVVLIGLGCFYPLIATRMDARPEWKRPLIRFGWAVFAVGFACGLFMLAGQLVKRWDEAAVHVSFAGKGLTLLAWLAISLRLFQLAAKPLACDEGISIATRRRAVYVAELALAFGCFAAYSHFPHLFQRGFIKWWPIIVFAIAFLSAGLGEWLKRARQTVLADPIQRSSLLLPIIPLAGVWWIHLADRDWQWSDWNRYSMLLLIAAGLYGMHGWLQQSIRMRSLSVGLCLLSFWSLLHSQPDLRFFQHPQFWLLPPSLATLIFVELNRERLHRGVQVSARYIATLIAYLSSSFEVFLKAFEGELWQPLLLLALSLLGVVVGILLQIRAFLICGVAFTLVALLSMVWHAQQAIGQVWPWWAFGIATGISLIVMLGYFEKNRPKVVAYLERLKQWDR